MKNFIVKSNPVKWIKRISNIENCESDNGERIIVKQKWMPQNKSVVRGLENKCNDFNEGAMDQKKR